MIHRLLTQRVGVVLVAVALMTCTSPLAAQRRRDRQAESAPSPSTTIILGRPTDASVALNVLAPRNIECRVDYGPFGAKLEKSVAGVKLAANRPTEIEIKGLAADSHYAYRIVERVAGADSPAPVGDGSFRTQRARGKTFSFGVQGDSHPEREGKMYASELYRRTMENAQKDALDFYVTLGDDFSIERLIERQTLSAETVNQVYARQRPFLGIVGKSAPLFLVNGNHEQAARYLLDGTPTNAAVLAGLARNAYFSPPAPDAFYGGDAEKVEHIGYLRDYYAWTWGDALFVVIDPYWHSAVAVDNEAGSRAKGDEDGKKKQKRAGRDLWDVTLGETQYRWLQKTLTESKATYKFVFSHHVLGTGRGGVECADLCEWGGKDRRGDDLFPRKRPGWEMPIHQLFVKTRVTIFFQGHDHLFARQEKDGVVYQETPNPADATYTAFNRDAYRSGDILPNSGHLRVTVAPERVKVDYIRAFRAADEADDKKNGVAAFSYEIPKKAPAKD